MLDQFIHLRGLPKSHGVVALAHNLIASSIQELSQPADTAHKETGVDVEENDGGISVGVLPVSKKGGLKCGDILKVKRGLEKEISMKNKDFPFIHNKLYLLPKGHH